MSLMSTVPVEVVGGTFFVSKLRNHVQIKTRLLERFAKIGFGIDHMTDDVLISNTDYGREELWLHYSDIFNSVMEEHIKNILEILNAPSKLNVDSCIPWFQQYRKNDTHGWHVHGDCNMASIYYVELPQGTPNTIFSMFGKKFSLNAGEGHIVTFPSMFSHCSPPNLTSNRKTIISFNMNII